MPTQLKSRLIRLEIDIERNSSTLFLCFSEKSALGTRGICSDPRPRRNKGQKKSRRDADMHCGGQAATQKKQ